MRGPDELDEAMRAAGASLRALPVVTDERVTTLERVIGDLGDGLFSFTWDTDPSVLQRAAEQTRSWARVRWGSLDEPRSFTATIACSDHAPYTTAEKEAGRAYRLPNG